MKTIGRVVFATLVGALMLVGGVVRALTFYGSARPRAGVEGDDPIGQEDLFGPGNTEGDGFTIYGREPVVAGRKGEPVGAYSGAPIIHY